MATFTIKDAGGASVTGWTLDDVKKVPAVYDTYKGIEDLQGECSATTLYIGGHRGEVLMGLLDDLVHERLRWPDVLRPTRKAIQGFDMKKVRADNEWIVPFLDLLHYLQMTKALRFAVAHVMTAFLPVVHEACKRKVDDTTTNDGLRLLLTGKCPRRRFRGRYPNKPVLAYFAKIAVTEAFTMEEVRLIASIYPLRQYDPRLRWLLGTSLSHKSFLNVEKKVDAFIKAVNDNEPFKVLQFIFKLGVRSVRLGGTHYMYDRCLWHGIATGNLDAIRIGLTYPGEQKLTHHASPIFPCMPPHNMHWNVYIDALLPVAKLYNLVDIEDDMFMIVHVIVLHSTAENVSKLVSHFFTHKDISLRIMGDVILKPPEDIHRYARMNLVSISRPIFDSEGHWNDLCRKFAGKHDEHIVAFVEKGIFPLNDVLFVLGKAIQDEETWKMVFNCLASHSILGPAEVVKRLVGDRSFPTSRVEGVANALGVDLKRLLAENPDLFIHRDFYTMRKLSLALKLLHTDVPLRFIQRVLQNTRPGFDKYGWRDLQRLCGKKNIANFYARNIEEIGPQSAMVHALTFGKVPATESDLLVTRLAGLEASICDTRVVRDALLEQ